MVYFKELCMKTQLLCTFTTTELLEKTLASIKSSYDIAFDTIYILYNVEDPEQICCTYNINVEAPLKKMEIPDGTISLHRKKLTNTLYTINALNSLVISLNGSMDKNYKINWEDYKNTILVTAYGKLKIVRTELKTIKKVSDIG